jgi:hypothetical protein
MTERRQRVRRAADRRRTPAGRERETRDIMEARIQEHLRARAERTGRRRCSRCACTKLLGAFYRNVRKLDGYSRLCKACSSPRKT